MNRDKRSNRSGARLFPGLVLFMVALLFFAAGASAQMPGEEKAPPSVINGVASGQPQDIIVLFDDTAIQEEAAILRKNIGADHDTPEILAVKKARYSEVKQRVLSQLLYGEQEVLRDYSHLPIVFMKVRTQSALVRLLDRSEVVRVYPDEKYRPFLSQSLALINQPAVQAAGKVGTGTTVAVFDTGLNYTLSAFGTCTSAAPGFCSDTNPPAAPAGCKVACVRDFTPTNDGFLDDDGHGTNVSGIVAGVAPDTRIAALDVFRTDGFAYSSDIIAAINWSINNKAAYNIVAINMSLGGGGSTSPCGGDVFATPVNNAKTAGILSSIASGNDGFTNMISSPGCVPAAVSVGAVYDANVGPRTWSITPPPGFCTDNPTAADKVICFSNSASFLTMLAPGCIITAAGWSMCGTSQAAPHIAGSIAVIKGANAFPSDTPDQTVSRMTGTGVLVLDTRNGITKPRIDLLSAASGGCTFSIGPTSQSFVATGGTGNVNVTTSAGCSWTAVSNASWITVTGGASGSGNGTVSYSVAANTGAARTGTMTIAGQTFTVNQSGSGGEISLGEAVDNTSLTWTTGGNANWYGQTSVSYYGGDAARSGAITHNQLSWIQTTVTGPGTLTFYWKVSSESRYDYLRFYIDGVEQAGRISGEVNWQQRTYSIPSGSHTLRWAYTKDGSVSSGADAGWLDYVVYTGSGGCSYSISPASQSFTSAGGSGSVGVTAGAGCSWTAVSNALWITVTGGASWSGNGTVSYSVAANTGAARTGTMTIAGQTFTVSQSAAGGGGAFSISGKVTSGTIGLSGVTMNLSGAASKTTFTDANGNYTFTALGNGSYTVTPSKTGYTFTPTNRGVSINGASVAGQNFTAARAR